MCVEQETDHVGWTVPASCSGTKAAGASPDAAARAHALADHRPGRASRRHPRPRPRLLLLLLLAGGAATSARAQGLEYDPGATLGASGAYNALSEVYSKARAWQDAYRRSASGACSGHRGSLCAPGGAGLREAAQLLMATSPQAFDSRTDQGGFSAVGQVKDQHECSACVAFVVLAAAQSTVACALKQDAKSSLSEADFFFCKSAPPNEERSCESSWSMRTGLEAFASLSRAGRYPVADACRTWAPGGARCGAPACGTTEPDLKRGTFVFARLEAPWAVQEFIRRHGSAVTRLDVFSDFRPFFEAHRNGVYKGRGPNAKFVESHAIQLIGYDNAEQAWLAKNSWGPRFAAGGFFRIAYSSNVGVGNPADTYGLKFTLNDASPADEALRFRLSPAPGGRPGCYRYAAAPSDYVSGVAAAFGLPIAQVLQDNTKVIPEPDMNLAGRTLLLCGLDLPTLPGGAAAGPPAGGGGGGGRGDASVPKAAGSAPPAPAPSPSPPPQSSEEEGPPRPLSLRSGPGGGGGWGVAGAGFASAPTPRAPARAAPPRTRLLAAGTYQGRVPSCTIRSQSWAEAMTFTPGPGAGQFQLETTADWSFMFSCRRRIASVCAPATGALAALCGASGEAWRCDWRATEEDTCPRVSVPRPGDYVVLCATRGAVAHVASGNEASAAPGCTFQSGNVLALTAGARRR